LLRKVYKKGLEEVPRLGVIDLLRRYFPYGEVRRWQWEIAEFIYNSLVSSDVALVEAPTGVGKTASALAASLAFSEETGSRVLFLVRTRNEAQAPLRELSKLRDRGITIEFALMRSRPDMCCLTRSRGLPYEEFLEECRYLRRTSQCQYYVNYTRTSTREVMSVLLDEDVVNAGDYVKSLCRLGVCPYEVSRDFLREAKFGVMTYYYLFSLDKPESVDINLEDSVLIIDEAHNLPSSICSINSFALSSYTVSSALSEAKRMINDPELRSRVIRSLKYLLTSMRAYIGKGSMVSMELSDVLQFFDDVEALREAYVEVMRRKREGGVPIPYTPLSKVLEFHARLTRSVRGFMVFLSRGEGGIELIHGCIDPSVASEEVLNSARGVVMMSATLPPRDYMVSMLGIRRGIREFRVGFRDYVGDDNYEVVVLDSVSSRYVERSEGTYAEIAKILTEVYLNSPINGAILAIFPSYSFLKSVRKYLGAGVRYIMELSDLSVDDVLSELARDKRRLVMAVAGGKLVEGVELRINGENLVGMVIVVGVPYPEPNDYLERAMEVLSVRLRDKQLAWELTYQWPAIVRIKQAVGRAFRSEHDRAFVVLMDRRISEGRLLRVFRDYFGKLRIIHNLDELKDMINRWAGTSSDPQSPHQGGPPSAE